MLGSYSLSWPIAIWVIAVTDTSACLIAQNATNSPSVTASFSLAIRGEQSMVKAGSPVWVVATVENKSDHDIRVYRAISDDSDYEDQGGWVYRVDVRDNKGATSSATEFYKLVQGRDPEVGLRTSGSGIKLKPGKTIEDRVNVSKLHELSQPGKYIIQFQRVDPETKTFVKSNEITVTVTP